MWEQNDGKGDNAIRNRVTAWMEKVCKSAQIDYIRRKSAKKRNTVYSQTEIADVPYEQDFRLVPEDEFDFAEDKLAKAFADLPLLRRRVLALTFIEEMSAPEIAEQLNCSVEYVYEQRRRALEKLRKQLTTGGENSDV